MDQDNNYSYFANRDCEYFPCHKNADPTSFNCLFCYCPLYALGSGCGGNFRYTKDGIKDCSACLLPHSKGGYDYIVKSFPKIVELVKKSSGNQG